MQTQDGFKDLFSNICTIAVVGLSGDPSKDSNRVASYLKKHGYRIIPVNPKEKEILGEKSYPDLRSIPETVHVVDVFRKSEFAPDLAKEAISIGAKVFWMQFGAGNDEAAKLAEAAGITVINEACMMQEHSKLSA